MRKQAKRIRKQAKSLKHGKKLQATKPLSKGVTNNIELDSFSFGAS